VRGGWTTYTTVSILNRWFNLLLFTWTVMNLKVWIGNSGFDQAVDSSTTSHISLANFWKIKTFERFIKIGSTSLIYIILSPPVSDNIKNVFFRNFENIFVQIVSKSPNLFGTNFEKIKYECQMCLSLKFVNENVGINIKNPLAK